MAAFEIFYLHFLIIKFFLSENKIKDNNNNNHQLYFFFEMYSCWTLIFDYFTLRMQARMIFRTREMDFKVEGPGRQPKFWILVALERLKQ